MITLPPALHLHQLGNSAIIATIRRMELDQDRTSTTITSYTANSVTVRGTVYTHNVVVTAGQVRPWAPRGFDHLTWEDFSALLTTELQILLVGIALPARRLPTSILAQLSTQPSQVMSLGAACRTFNLLLSENRLVVAALLLT